MHRLDVNLEARANPSLRRLWTRRLLVSVLFSGCLFLALKPLFLRWQIEGKIREWDHKIAWLVAQEKAPSAPGAPPPGVTPLPPRLEADIALSEERSPYYISHQTRLERGATLTIPPGVEIRFGPAAGLVVLGTLRAHGSGAHPVRLRAAQPGVEWAGIFLGGAGSGALLQEAELVGAYYGVKAVRTRLEMVRCRFLNVREPCSGDRSQLRFTGCDVAFTNFQARGNVNLFKFWKGTATLEDCDIRCPPTDFKVDAFDVDHVEAALFRRTRIHGVPCEGADGIDAGLGSRRVLIADCLIAGFVDKGVSVGEQARVRIENSVITGCGIGVGIKDRADAELRGVTLHDTGVGVECYEKVPGAGGGSGRVMSCVFSHVREAEVSVDHLSTLDVSGCVSDKNLLAGPGNRAGTIRLTDPARGRFEMAGFEPAGGGAQPLGSRPGIRPGPKPRPNGRPRPGSLPGQP